MPLTRMKSTMVESPFDSSTTLYHNLVSKVKLSLMDFGFDPTNKSTLSESLDRAKSYVLQRNYGTIEIPTNAGISDYPVYLDVVRGEHTYELRCRCWMNKYPTTESRPTGDSFQVGDIVYNTDYTDQSEVGWLLTSTEGWLATSHLKKWYSSLERVKSLPEPSILQLGRQLILDKGTTDTLYVCRRSNNSTYYWYKMDNVDDTLTSPSSTTALSSRLGDKLFTRLNMITKYVEDFSQYVTTSLGYEDWSEALSKAFSSGYNILGTPGKEYKISKPIQVKVVRPYNETTPVVIDMNKSVIKKVTSTQGTGSETCLAVTPNKLCSYEVDSIITIELYNQRYSGGLEFKNIVLKGVDSGARYKTDYGIYAPYITHVTFNNCHIYDCMTAIVSNNSWMCNYKDIYVSRCIGVIHILEGGTSSVLEHVWGHDGDTTWDTTNTYRPTSCFILRGVYYPSLHTVVCERMNNCTLYDMHDCRGGSYSLATEDTVNSTILKASGATDIQVKLVCLVSRNKTTSSNQEIPNPVPQIHAQDNSRVYFSNISFKWSNYDKLVRVDGNSLVRFSPVSIDGFDHTSHILENNIYSNVVLDNSSDTIVNEISNGRLDNPLLYTLTNSTFVHNVLTRSTQSDEGSLRTTITRRYNNFSKLIINYSGSGSVVVNGKTHELTADNSVASIFIYEKVINLEFKVTTTSLTIKYIMINSNLYSSVSSYNYVPSNSEGEFRDLHLLGNWTSNPDEYYPPQISKSDSGIVRLRGIASGGTTGGEFSRIPIELAPSKSMVFSIPSPYQSFEQSGQVQVYPDGVIKIINGVNSFCSLDGISYLI